MADESTLPPSTFDTSHRSLQGAHFAVTVIILLIISITGIIGNSIVIIAIVLSRKLRSTLNWFILNLACADLLTSICLLFYVASLLINEEKRVFPLAFWIFGHFVIVVTAYLKLWRFIAHRAVKLKPTKNFDKKIQNEICKDTSCPDENTVTQQGGLVNENTVLRVSHSSEYLGSQNCDISKGEKSGQPENPMQHAKTLTVSPYLEEIESTDGGRDIGAREVPVCVEGSETKLAVKKQTESKIDKKLLAVTKNLLVILVAFVICFIPYAVSLCLPVSYIIVCWLLTLLLFNSCINPIIYATRIRVFREVMVCIIRCRLGSIPMPIDLVRKMRTTG
eukprot:XP_011670397.1 PREDICTED: alpha-1D adrenergic receptor-like [Strongylocentrotus purpuratus]